MTLVKTILIQKGTIPRNYRPVMFLHLTLKILTVQIKLYAVDYFRKNRKDTAREQEEQVTYYA